MYCEQCRYNVLVNCLFALEHNCNAAILNIWVN